MSFALRTRQLIQHFAPRTSIPPTASLRSLHHRTMSTSIPSTQKGVVINKTGGTEVLEYKTDLPVPTPKADQVLIRNHYIGVNYIDTYFRTGLYPAPHFPYTLGRDGEGVVASIPSSASGKYHFKEGDKVVYLSEGAYAEYVAAPAAKVVKVPDEIQEKVAGAALLQGLTALTLIRETYEVKKGDWVLVHAAAGGVGLWLVQLVKASGGRVIATASTDEKRKLASDAGAEVVVGYGEEELKAKVKEVTGGKGVEFIADGVGKATFDLDLELVARKGTIASFGNASGPVDPLVISRLSPKNAKVARPTLFNYIATPEEFDHYVNLLWEYIIKHKINVAIHEVYPLEDVARAHKDLEGRKTTGKLLLKP